MKKEVKEREQVKKVHSRKANDERESRKKKKKEKEKMERRRGESWVCGHYFLCSRWMDNLIANFHTLGFCTGIF